jgi:hypothetical protein
MKTFDFSRALIDELSSKFPLMAAGYFYDKASSIHFIKAVPADAYYQDAFQEWQYNAHLEFDKRFDDTDEMLCFITEDMSFDFAFHDALYSTDSKKACEGNLVLPIVMTSDIPVSTTLICAMAA